MDSETYEAGFNGGETHEVKRVEQRDEEEEEEDYKSQPHSGNGASPGKIFIGGLARETTSAQFIKHFGKYGEIIDSVIMKDRKTGQPRGFGFVTYSDPSVVDQVIQDTHVINGKQVEIKRTIPKGAGGSKDFKTKKIFVGGIPTTVNDDEFRDFFSQFGEVKEHQIMRDHSTSRSRGFGFVTFDTEQEVDDLLAKGNKLELAGAQVEIKKAEPRKPNPSQPPSKRYNDSRPALGGGFGDNYGGFGGGSGYRSAAGAYSGRGGAYGGYGGGEFGGYGVYGGGGYGAYRGEPSVGYSGRYGGAFSRGYELGGGYGGPSESYGGYGGAAGGYGGAAGGYAGASGGYAGVSGGYAGAGGASGGYGSSYDAGLGGGYGGGGSAGSFYGSRGGYGGAGSSRYHPYGR